MHTARSVHGRPSYMGSGTQRPLSNSLPHGYKASTARCQSGVKHCRVPYLLSVYDLRCTTIVSVSRYTVLGVSPDRYLDNRYTES